MPTTVSECDIHWTPKRVRQLRERLGLTLEDAASKIGVSPRTWLSWELPSQDRQPSPSHEILLSLLANSKL